MRAIQIRHTGGPEVLDLVEIPVPRPGPGQVLVRVHAIGVNFIDTYLREGRYPATLPFVPGQEAAGTVEALGDGVDGIAQGRSRRLERHSRNLCGVCRGAIQRSPPYPRAHQL